MPAKKASAAKKPRARRTIAKGDYYVCDVCGLSVVVDEVCGCEEVHEILCCEQPMRKRATKAKAAK
jgi:ribosomal 30S subunit maturation factor RimM